MKVKILKMQLVFISFFLVSCASVPRESVQLNQEIKVGLKSLQESHLSFLDLYIETKKNQIDKLEKKAIDDFFSKIALGFDNPDAPPFGKDELISIQETVDSLREKSNNYKNELDKLREKISSSIAAEYSDMYAANSTITGLLQSLVDLKDSTNDGILLIKETTGGRVDFENMDETINKYLMKFGDDSSDVQNISNNVIELLNLNPKEE